MIIQNEELFPDHLRSYDALAQHFRAHLGGLSTTEKGDRFAHFVEGLIPQTEYSADFAPPEVREKKSHDKGVDLIAEGKDGKSRLYIEVKLWIDRADMIDSIISKFRAHTDQTQGLELEDKQYRLNLDEKTPHFLVVTLSRLEGVIESYEGRAFASKEFYYHLLDDERLGFIHGDQILHLLRTAYIKVGQLPTDLTLHLETEAVSRDNVFLGIVSSTELQRLYNQFGDALFFENVRDFLGFSENKPGAWKTPNEAILETVRNRPGKMLERNNRIVMRADKVEWDASQNELRLNKGSVVNGCQTTMCIVGYATEPCYVPIKVVETTESWDITKAANLQNQIPDIDLEIARHLRPQLVKRTGATTGVQIDNGEKSAFQIIEEIYSQKVAYEETRLLYIGLFSRAPNNIFRADYTRLRSSLIERFYQEDPHGEEIFETLFALQSAAQKGLRQARETFTNSSYAGLFDRYYKSKTATYGCFISILALCGAIGVDITKIKPEGTLEEYEQMRDFLGEARALLDNDTETFLKYYKFSVKVWMQEMRYGGAGESETLQRMTSKTRSMNFSSAFQNLQMEADLRM